MTPDEVLKVSQGEPPVLCRDGKIGLLTVFPDDQDELCGVQVCGEESHRWIHSRNLTASAGGAFRECGAPPRPATYDGDFEQAILAAAWGRCGGASIPPDAPRPREGGRVIRAEPGKPWPDPPGGRWLRDAATGDLVESE